jgi:hypothetical protein
MPNKPYKPPESDEPMILNEPVVAYPKRKTTKTSSSDKWNPNVPFHGTQEEWWEHFHQIEEGNFMTLEEFDRKFEAWRTEYLANKLK